MSREVEPAQGDMQTIERPVMPPPPVPLMAAAPGARADTAEQVHNDERVVEGPPSRPSVPPDDREPVVDPDAEMALDRLDKAGAGGPSEADTLPAPALSARVRAAGSATGTAENAKCVLGAVVAVAPSTTAGHRAAEIRFGGDRRVEPGPAALREADKTAEGASATDPAVADDPVLIFKAAREAPSHRNRNLDEPIHVPCTGHDPLLACGGRGDDAAGRGPLP